MNQKYGGYTGKMLRVYLSDGTTETFRPDDSFLRMYIDGTGFCAKILYDETGPQTGPLGPENRLVLATGPLTGTMWPTNCRMAFAAKSTLTGIWRESNAGGVAVELQKLEKLPAT